MEIVMKNQVGRPNDKELYIDSLLSTLKYTTKDENLLKVGLNKLNASDILVLSACISRGLNCDLASFLKKLPAKTVAQLKRYHDVVEIYKHLERNDDDIDSNTSETEISDSYQIS